ncbi:cobalamin-dependent protein [Methanonatronarchaeum sp. AMET6-2]|uniref:cobalamin-dependent protein n=1 Tax=Methanonatronarchaeum sp. AMET6-2 TaxID=2933293 RepID=UPI00121B3343|nr:cobalamin-dependent protein [Methanonatronarchaeum sp. AMET6-2]RZN62286.1 MAG: cobalamin-binding protein [Methanonatronarchaeia archaeon]UOY10194.1 cobalamin-dependent protein [Methanonatronarchaeum sp. AMET6-2]
MSKEEILKDLHDGVMEMDEEKTSEAAQRALDEGVEPMDAIMDGLVSGIAEVGELYDEGERFVPEVLMSSEALYAGLDILKPHVDASDLGVEGKVVIGVAEGDVHDIGKNLVRLMLDVSGMDVIDLGKDVPNDQFAAKAKEEDANVIAVSAMMTSTMLGIKDIVEDAEKTVPNVKILAGGAPLTEKSAIEEFGADGYAPDATKAAKRALELMKE